MKVEVRCCCNPERLIGWLEVPADRDMRFYTRAHWREAVTTVTIPIARIFIGARSYPAFKSNEVPMETLRMIPCFTENLGTERGNQ